MNRWRKIALTFQSLGIAVLAGSLLPTSTALGHHSYALFDTGKTRSVAGVAAKFEWINPHVFIWVYVPDKAEKSGHKLHAFETGSLVVMARDGWDRNSIRPGDRLSVEYFPLRDGRPGGSLVQVTLASGRVFKGDPYGQRVITQMKAAAAAKGKE